MIRKLLRSRNTQSIEADLQRLADAADTIAARSDRKSDIINQTMQELVTAKTEVLDEKYRAQEIRRQISTLLNI